MRRLLRTGLQSAGAPLAWLGDRPVVTPYEIRDGRRIETTLLEA